MSKCPITYVDEVQAGETYSSRGLKYLARGLHFLHDLPFDQGELQREAMTRAQKMSIQGIQVKLSAILNIKKQAFDIVDTKGRFILKPQSLSYPHLPENEDLTMKLAQQAGIEVPIHGLVYAKDKTLVYFIKRFDRQGRGTHKIPLEDFAQLSGETRETKYSSSMERVVELLETFCTFPLLEKQKLLQRTLFNFLVGNEDMHLKNFSLITSDEVVKLAPAYDFLNSSIVLRAPEELALPLRGKKRGITRKDLLEYFGKERLKLSSAVIDEIVTQLKTSHENWSHWIEISFLPQQLKESYKALVNLRSKILMG